MNTIDNDIRRMLRLHGMLHSLCPWQMGRTAHRIRTAMIRIQFRTIFRGSRA